MSAQGNVPASRERRRGAAAAALIVAFVAGAAGFAGGFLFGSRRAVVLAQSPVHAALPPQGGSYRVVEWFKAITLGSCGVGRWSLAQDVDTRPACPAPSAPR